MPYISQKDRKRLSPIGLCDRASHPGELNYQVTRLILDYCGELPNYEAYNAAIGALECAKLELYSRRLRAYEDAKCQENGEVY